MFKYSLKEYLLMIMFIITSPIWLVLVFFLACVCAYMEVKMEEACGEGGLDSVYM